MRVRVITASLALAATATAGLSGCGVDTIAQQAGYMTKSSSTPTPSPTATATPKSTATPDVFIQESSVPAVAHPWQPGEFQKGLQILWNTKADYVQPDAQRMLDYVVRMGANSVGITFPVYINSLTPTNTYAGPDTPSVAELEYVVQQAKLRKLRVTLQPSISFDPKYNATNPDAWVGNIDPVPGWFTTYFNFLSPYLRMADDTSVNEFVLGNDMVSQQQSPEWPRVITNAAKLYSGEISYTMNSYLGKKPASFKNYGLNFFPAFPEMADNADIPELTKAMAKLLTQRQDLIDQHVTIQQVAIAGRSNAYLSPKDWGDPDLDTQAKAANTVMPEVQSAWFSAAYLAARQTGANGIYFGGITSGQTFGQHLNRTEEPLGDYVGRIGGRAIKLMFKHD